MSLPAASVVKVFVTHAGPLLEMGIVTALSGHADIEVSSFGPDSAEAQRESVPGGYDVIVADYNAALRIEAPSPDSWPRVPVSRVMVMSTHLRESEVRLALEKGVHGYVLLDCSPEELAAGVRALGRGSRYFCQEVAQCVAESLSREALTTRELQVLRHLAQGRSNKVIARELDVALGTVKAHVKSVLAKLNAVSRTQALSIAVKRGLVEDPPAMQSRSKH